MAIGGKQIRDVSHLSIDVVAVRVPEIRDLDPSLSRWARAARSAIRCQRGERRRSCG
jgi:hypothetical protein